jgi:hypothetical protein
LGRKSGDRRAATGDRPPAVKRVGESGRAVVGEKCIIFDGQYAKCCEDSLCIFRDLCGIHGKKVLKSLGHAVVMIVLKFLEDYYL